MGSKVFITDTRQDVLNGEYNGSQSNLRSHKSRIRAKAKVALSELIEVASSPVIDNTEVFSPEQVELLLYALTAGRGGLEGDDIPVQKQAWTPDPQYRLEMLEVLENTRQNYLSNGN